MEFGVGVNGFTASQLHGFAGGFAVTLFRWFAVTREGLAGGRAESGGIAGTLVRCYAGRSSGRWSGERGQRC